MSLFSIEEVCVLSSASNHRYKKTIGVAVILSENRILLSNNHYLGLIILNYLHHGNWFIVLTFFIPFKAR